MVDAVVFPVEDGPRVVPTEEHRLDSRHKLFPGVRWRLSASVVSGDVLEVCHHLPEALPSQFIVQFHRGTRLVPGERLLEETRLDVQDHVRVDLYEATVGIVGGAGIAHHGGQPLDNFVVDSQVEDRVHHARHGHAGAGTDRHQQGTACRAEVSASVFFQLPQPVSDNRRQAVRQCIPVGEVVPAHLGGNHEARRHRKSQPGHLAKVAALPAKKVRHGGVTFPKAVHQLGRRWEIVDHWMLLFCPTAEPDTPEALAGCPGEWSGNGLYPANRPVIIPD